MTTSLVIDRSSLSLADLTIGTDPSASYWIASDGIGRPGIIIDRTYASARGYHGDVLVDARKQQSTLPLRVYVNGSSAAQVQTRLETLQTAVQQFAYTVTVTVDDAVTVWPCDMADFPEWVYDSGQVKAGLQPVPLSIPVYPIPGV